jgi:hypothetical protein
MDGLFRRPPFASSQVSPRIGALASASSAAERAYDGSETLDVAQEGAVSEAAVQPTVSAGTYR